MALYSRLLAARHAGSLLATGCLLCVTPLACGDKGDRAPPPPDGKGSGGRTNTGEGGAPPTQSVNENAPIVELRAPEEGEVLTNSLEASCTATRGDGEAAGAVEAGSIAISIEDEKSLPVKTSPVSPGAGDEYNASIDLSSVDPGRYSVVCSATSSGTTPLTTTHRVDVLIDHGPRIEAISPIAEGFIARSGQHDFRVKISPVRLFAGDTDADLDGTPVLIIDEKEFTLEPKKDEENVFWVEAIDFEDETIFPDEPPGNTKVSVRAKNIRGVAGSLDYPVYVDGVGPKISVSSPSSGSIVGTRATFTFQASDDYSGVDWESLVVEVKDVEIPFDPDSPRWSQSGNTAVLELVTTDLSVGTQMSVNATVRDLAGNQSSDGAESTYYLDQQQPILSLDPPNLRTHQTQNDLLVCSHSFDPLGAAIGHGDSTFNLALFRAFAWDMTNEEAGQLNLHYATVDSSSLRLWMTPAGAPLVVDTNQDGICDDISASVDVDVDTVELGPLGPSGAPFLGDGTGDITNPDMTGSCAYSSNPETTPPAGRCNGDSDLTYVTGQALSGTTIPAVYATLIGSGPTCTGDQQSISALVGDVEGWICAAVRGSDKAGNVGVSAPIAVCLDNSEVPGQPSCWGQGSAGAPDCKDDCTPLTFPSGGLIVRRNP